MNNSYSDETKAACMAALLQGQSISSVAKEYKIPRGTVANWAGKVRNGENYNLVATTKKEEIGELLIEYLKANLKALRIQVEQFADKKWLAKQRADEAAVLHGVLTDKAVRLLEAFSRDDSDTPAED